APSAEASKAPLVAVAKLEPGKEKKKEPTEKKLDLDF
ncbi:unnamed protein product, partial [marine sediment metagenome]